MKRVLTFILMLALFAITPPIVLANAEEVVAEEKQEILFQGIPWDSDANTVRKMLIAKGFPIGEVMSNHSINYFAPGLRLYVSSSTVSHLFKQRLGVSFYRYVTQRRLIAAKNLIQKGVLMENVAAKTGFADYSGFYRAFRKEYGVSPRQYRTLQESGSKTGMG